MSERTIISAAGAPAAIGPYSHAAAGAGFVFTSGQIGLDPTSGELAEGVAAQAEQAMRNLAAVLDAAGTSFDRVLKTVIFLSDMADFAAVNEVYAARIGGGHPARSTVAVAGLPKGALVEIEMVALAGEAARG